MKILIDNGHGSIRLVSVRLMVCFVNMPILEIAAEVTYQLRRKGYDAELLVPEYDVALIERVHRVNVKCQSASNVLLVSIHCNAAGNGKEWKSARLGSMDIPRTNGR